MSKKQTTNSTQQSNQQQHSTYTQNHAWDQAPINAQTQGVIDMANQAPHSDPSIQHRYASMEQDIRRSYQDPMGAYTTPFVRGRAQLSQLLGVQADRDKAMREDYHSSENQQFGRKVAAASLTQPQAFITGGTSDGTSSGTAQGRQTTSQPMWPELLDAGLGGAASIL